MFLDEIGNLPYHLQSKLLTAIQSRSVVRVGSNEPIPVNIRLICATNCDLEEMVAKGKFREDLLYRINTIHIEIPPLRERKEDIIPLAERFIDRFCKQYDKGNILLSTGAQEKLRTYPWYGNIRELEHAVEKAVIINEDGILSEEHFHFPENSGSCDRNKCLYTGRDGITNDSESDREMQRKPLGCSGTVGNYPADAL